METLNGISLKELSNYFDTTKGWNLNKAGRYVFDYKLPKYPSIIVKVLTDTTDINGIVKVVKIFSIKQNGKDFSGLTKSIPVNIAQNQNWEQNIRDVLNETKNTSIFVTNKYKK
jgi:hypothetical protein